jgi:hypothetical protein
MRRASATIASIMITAITLLLGCGGLNPISTIQSEEPSVSSPPSDCVHPRGPTVIVVGTKDAEPLRSFLCDAGITVPPIRLTLPSDLGDANAIIVDDSANVSPSDTPTLEKFCEKGKGVVLVGHIPAKLATGNIVPENGEIDISSIASWFGGARRMQRYKAGVYVRDPYPLFSLPSGVQPKPYPFTSWGGSWYALRPSSWSWCCYRGCR